MFKEKKFIGKYRKKLGDEWNKTIDTYPVSQLKIKEWFKELSLQQRMWIEGQSDWEILQDTENCFEACKSKNNYWDSYIRIEWKQVD